MTTIELVLVAVIFPLLLMGAIVVVVKVLRGKGRENKYYGGGSPPKPHDYGDKS